jgi:hypothetical protein
MLTNVSENLINITQTQFNTVFLAFKLPLMDRNILPCFAVTRNPAGTAYKHSMRT